MEWLAVGIEQQDGAVLSLIFAWIWKTLLVCFFFAPIMFVFGIIGAFFCAILGSSECMSNGPWLIFLESLPYYPPVIALGAAAYVIFNPKKTLRWLHFVFVRHPADRHVTRSPSLDTAKRPMDVRGLARDMERQHGRPRPAWVSENMAEKAAAAANRLRKETEVLDEAIERERKRSEYEDRRR